MPRLPLSSTGSTSMERLIGHNPVILAAWLKLEDAFFASPRLSADLREQVRRALAFGNECQYCMAKAGPPRPGETDRKMQTAVAFAELAGMDHRGILPAHIDLLREEFSVAEAAELVAFVSFISAAQMFGAMMDLQAADLDPGLSARPG